ncbi:MAG: hypothetical protein UV80_C0003G0012 [Candidatus Peregrinibacteria bacterium GW2011_GWF2_43_17]|nr:MAG: hypothetical protein UV80_C0003G0012 [Candidatus Peregrinibacteria bacterium GW2011_GWF2_43_17]KKT19345.1 MAG: hypothetical protein UW03_C0020G0050 [Candidatus Peregrinibacteria bacterium GW2011_GWA2_43_8]HAU40150.1 hypothetical protein [Candidatus Peregrinibacteria bacterium]
MNPTLSSSPDVSAVGRLSDEQFGNLALIVNRDQFSQVEFGQFTEQVMVALQKLLKDGSNGEADVCLEGVPCRVAFWVQELSANGHPYVECGFSIMHDGDDDDGMFPQEVREEVPTDYEMLLCENQIMGGCICFVRDDDGRNSLERSAVTFVDSKVRDDYRDKGLDSAFWLSLNSIGRYYQFLVKNWVQADQVSVTMVDAGGDRFGPGGLTRTDMARFIGARQTNDIDRPDKVFARRIC